MICQPAVDLSSERWQFVLNWLFIAHLTFFPGSPSPSFSLPAVHTSHVPPHSVTWHGNGGNREGGRGAGRKSRQGKIHLTFHTATNGLLQMAFEALSLICLTSESFLPSTSLISYPLFWVIIILSPASLLSLYPPALMNFILSSSMSPHKSSGLQNRNVLMPLKMGGS